MTLLTVAQPSAFKLPLRHLCCHEAVDPSVSCLVGVHVPLLLRFPPAGCLAAALFVPVVPPLEDVAGQLCRGCHGSCRSIMGLRALLQMLNCWE